MLEPPVAPEDRRELACRGDFDNLGRIDLDTDSYLRGNGTRVRVLKICAGRHREQISFD